jgi:hypothetical protein
LNNIAGFVFLLNLAGATELLREAVRWHDSRQEK